jgi:hypothetical protein
MMARRERMTITRAPLEAIVIPASARMGEISIACIFSLVSKGKGATTDLDIITCA